ncbi:uncharacterized protein METZ01_LOCUS423163, partial [marine metagenome]
APNGWSSPLVMIDNPKSVQSSDLFVDEEIFISWTVSNDSRMDINQLFFVDLYFDDFFLSRWHIAGLKSKSWVSLIDWEGLKNHVKATTGSHLLKLVIDPTDWVAETDETDNVYEIAIEWLSDTLQLNGGDQLVGKLPDLVPVTPKQWEGTIIASSYSGAVVNGSLSVRDTTYISYAFKNAGSISIPENVWVHLYLDDVLLVQTGGAGLLAEQTVEGSEWPGLFDTVNILPGRHTLRLELDPNDLITEADEGNNSIEQTFTWGKDHVETKP